MQITSVVHSRETREVKTIRGTHIIAVATTIALASLAVHTASSARAESAAKSAPVAVENIAGGTAKRITLSAKAAERLGIEIGTMSEETVVRKQMVSGLVISPIEKAPEPASNGFSGFNRTPVASASKQSAVGFGAFGRAGSSQPTAVRTSASTPSPDSLVARPVVQSPAPQPPAEAPASALIGDAWLQVTVSPGEWERLAKDKPARVLPLGTRDKFEKEIFALPSGTPPVEDTKRSMLTLYYIVSGKDHGLPLNNRMRVELQLSGSEEKQKVVPYSSVYYDGKGNSWVYVNTKPLTYERQRIAIDRVVGDVAILSEGPPVGTPVVKVGAALLYGTEVFGK